MGVLGWTPKQFYESELEDSLTALDGRLKEDIRQERIFRRLAEFVIAPYREKGGPSMMKMWPIAMDEELKSKENKATQRAAYAMLAEFRKKEQARKLENGNTDN